eukprot:scaffold28110_cov71-Phaeocystis_antarctica.AAC.5
MPCSVWVASAASRMPDSKRFRKYPEQDARATRCALNSTPSAQMAKSVSRSSCQRATSEAWCGMPPRSVSLGAAPAAVDCENDEAVELAVAVRRASAPCWRSLAGAPTCSAVQYISNTCDISGQSKYSCKTLNVPVPPSPSPGDCCDSDLTFLLARAGDCAARVEVSRSAQPSPSSDESDAPALSISMAWARRAWRSPGVAVRRL